MVDKSLAHASDVIQRMRGSVNSAPVARSFFDKATSKASYVGHDPIILTAAVIDSVRDSGPGSGRISTKSAEIIASDSQLEEVKKACVLETYAHIRDGYQRSRFRGDAQCSGRYVLGVQANSNVGAIQHARRGTSLAETNDKHYFEILLDII